MLIGALGVHPTFYPAEHILKAALYLLNQYVYYNSLTYLYKIVTKTLTGASLTACCNITYSVLLTLKNRKYMQLIKQMCTGLT